MSSKMEFEYEFKFENEEDYERIISKIRKEANKLSLELDELSSSFKESAKNQSIAADNLSAFGSEVSDSVKQINIFGKELSKSVKNMDNLITSMNQAQQEAEQLDAMNLDGFFNGIEAGASALVSMEESTREYRMLMANLESTSANAGYSIAATTESFRQLYGVLGDENTAASALTSLQGLTSNQEQLNTLIDASVGAWATYGESIPIESFTSAIAETVKMGEASGEFSTLLSELGLKEDEFNAKLQATNDESVRLNTVLDLLASEGLAKAGAEWQTTNEALLDSYDSAYQLNDLFARIGELVAPIINNIVDVAVDLANKILYLIEIGVPIIPMIGSITGAVSALVATLQFGKILGTLQAGFDGVSLALKTIPFGGTVAIIATLVGAIVGLWLTNEDFRNAVINIWNTIKETFSSVVAGITGAISSAVSAVANAYNSIVTSFSNMKAAISTTIGNIKTAIVTGFQSAVQFIKNLGSSAWTWGSDMISGFVSGIMSGIGRVISAAKSIASQVRAYLHFTVPDKGPLADADEYGPDFMKLLSKGITDNIGLVRNAAQVAASAMVVHPQMIAAGSTTNSMTRFGNVSINVYGAEGQNVNALADAVMDRMQMLVTQKEVAFSV